MMCDPGMKRRQQSVLTNEVPSTETYTGDLFRLFSTAKTMSWLTNLHFLPLDNSQSDLSTRVDDDKSMLSFLVSCLATCLDCACDLFEPEANLSISRADEAVSNFEAVSSVIACICLWLSNFCMHLRVLLHPSVVTADESWLRLRIAAKEVQPNLFVMLAMPLKKCLLRLTNSGFHSENADLALLSVLGLVRATVGVAVAHVEIQRNEETENVPSVRPAEQSSEDDLFGGMDDDLFMNIDLDNGGIDGPQSVNHADDKEVAIFKDLWTILTDVIKLTKVRL